VQVVGNGHGASATPDNVSSCRHDGFPHPGPLPEGEGAFERASRDFHSKEFRVERTAKIDGGRTREGCGGWATLTPATPSMSSLGRFGPFRQLSDDAASWAGGPVSHRHTPRSVTS